jgi:hypothetical protein
VNVVVKVVRERAIGGDRLLVYTGTSESRLELSGILWVNHEVSSEIARRLEARDEPQQQ